MDNSSPEPMTSLYATTIAPPLLEAKMLEAKSDVEIPTNKILVRILIVDDSDIDRDTYIRYLQSDTDYSYEITKAETLEEGLELWRSQHPDVILLDINLPDGNGLELLEAMSKNPSPEQSCVIILTGKGDEQTAVRAMKLGADDYLVKSHVTPLSLCHAVNQVHNGNITKLQLVRSQQQQAELYQSLKSRTNQLQSREIEFQKISERLALALQSGAIGSWEWIIADDVTYWDERMYELYAIREEDDHLHLNDIWLNKIHHDDRSFTEALIEKALLGDAEYDTEFRVVNPDHSIRFIRAYGTVVRDAKGVPQKMYGINFDISDRKQIEAQLLRTNEELIHATRLKDEFLANMSHELRTPLTAVLGMSEILQKEMLGSINERQQRALSSIRKGGQHLLELINDILDLSKISTGQMELNLDCTSVQNVCDSSLVYIKQQAFQKDIEVDSNIPSNIGNIIVDERRIRQVLINLLINAVKFTPNGGKVELLVSVGYGNTWEGDAKIPIQFKNQNLPLILFQVTDTGIGIAAKDLCRLFQPFVQLDSGLNRQYEGTGLGLVMVKQIAELHGGQVAVDSELGQGSNFSVALPYQICQSAPQSPNTITPFSLPEKSSPLAPLILLAEDNEENIATFTAYLNAYEYRVILAKNGEEALVMVKAYRPDVILMDIQMPVMDGLEAMQLIRSDPQFSAIPIIALTARAMEGDQETCISAGANQYLSKPLELEKLVLTIRQVLNP
jgi:signal transduction histidine kinase/DNA-binding response OmpR family regulator